MWPFKWREGENIRQFQIEKDELWLRIEALGFFGQSSDLPDGKYTVAWADREPSGLRGGFKNSGHGRYILACEGILFSQEPETLTWARVCLSNKMDRLIEADPSGKPA